MKLLAGTLLAVALAAALALPQGKVTGGIKVTGGAKGTGVSVTLRGIVFNGTNQSAYRSLSGSPWNSMGAHTVIFRMRAVTSDPGRVLQFGQENVGDGFALAASQSAGRLDFGETREGASIFHTPTSLTNIVGMVQFDPANTRWTMETWTADCAGYVSGNTPALADSSNYNIDCLSIGAGCFNTINSNPHFDWIGIYTGAVALSSGNCPGAEPPVRTYLLLWKFDADDGTDSSGNGLTATLRNSPTFENTP